MLQNLKRKQEGFTIIEVMIVLVIAAVILLIVFLAVPALQRNSRNTQRRNDVSNYLAAVNEWSNNNNGATPVTASLSGANGINDLAKPGFYTLPTTVVTGGQSTSIALNTMQLVTGARCDGTTGNTVATSSPRTIAIRYSVENSTGGEVKQCQES